MVLKVRRPVGGCLVIGNIDTCFVATAELSRDKHFRRYWCWADGKPASKNADKLFPNESLVPPEWYQRGGAKRRCANMARLQKTDGALWLVVFSEDAILLNADGKEVMSY